MMEPFASRRYEYKFELTPSSIREGRGRQDEGMSHVSSDLKNPYSIEAHSDVGG